ncbi:neprilysin-3 [Rhipicephalus sanguineus]|uniref:neprilysin-3 n=1 Tax=Rhipicephalus sanguineus TaxID=34632 RepID=UPI0020C4C0A2|nr:neprilysin-3 [Rhipicephalus sanguineus]
MERVGSSYQDDQWPPEQSSTVRSKPRGDIDPCVCCFRSTLGLAGLIVVMLFLTKIVDKTMGQRVTAAADHLLPSVDVPDRSQTAVQKAVGMFRACLAAPVDNRRVEMHALKDFMVSLDIDLLAEESSDPNPGRDVVRLSLEYGLPAFVEFRVNRYQIPRGKPLLEVALANSDDAWFAERVLLRSNVTASYYSAAIAHYSGRAPSKSTKALVSQLSALEDEVQTFMIKEKERLDEHWTFLSVRNILDPAEEQKKDEFERIIKEYSRGRYTDDDGVYVNSNAHALLKLLVTSGREAEFHRLVSWSIVRQLAGFGRSSETFSLMPSLRIWYKCVVKVSQVMEAPLMGVYLLQAVPEDYLAEVDSIFSRLKKFYETQLRHSSWLDSLSLQYALTKLRAMRMANGLPHDMRNARDMDARFAEFPESPSGGSFWRAWLSAARIVNRLGVISNSSSDIVFTSGSGVAYYGTVLNEVFVPAGMIGKPVFYKQGPAAHNYGVIGMIIAHEMTHGYDAQGVNIDAGGLWRHWLTQWSRWKHRSVMHCLQLSHAKVSKTDNLDRHSSENLADFVGSLVSHAAFSSLPDRLRRITVPGNSALNLTSEQLYFVSRCVIWCTRIETRYQDYNEGSHAAYRARCNVPAMNMPSFGEAFNCPPGSQMNPVDKCVF